MKSHLQWLRQGRAPRGTPGHRGAPRRLLVLGSIAALALLPAGCQSGPLGDCGSCNSCGFFRRATSRVIRRPSGCCDSGVVGDSTLGYSAPSTVVAPPVPAAPIYTPGAAGSVPSTVPVTPDQPTNLDPLPKARIGPSSGHTGSTSGAGASRSGYYTRQTSTRTAVRLDAGASPRSDSNPRPARGGATREESQDDDIFDHLPPLALPGEVTQAETASPAPSAPRPEGKAGERDVFGDSARPGDRGAEDAVSLSVPADASTGGEATPADNGIARFASVDPRLAGGSQPSSAGLAWLVEKGYRTVLDLRESSEVSPDFIAEAARRGLRYVALPVNLASLDADRLARFQFELDAPEARPLFFFDSDGSRAGALWYVRRVTRDGVDAQLARREAEDIGLKSPAAWKSATDYVQKLQAARPHPAPIRTGAADPASTSAAGSAPSSQHASGRPADQARAEQSSPSKRPEAGSGKASARTESSTDASGSYPTQDPLNWKPFAAILLTGLSLPLAYWTRTVIPDAIARAWASLPGPELRRQSLPPGSGA